MYEQYFCWQKEKYSNARSDKNERVTKEFCTFVKVWTPLLTTYEYRFYDFKKKNSIVCILYMYIYRKKILSWIYQSMCVTLWKVDPRLNLKDDKFNEHFLHTPRSSWIISRSPIYVYILIYRRSLWFMITRVCLNICIYMRMCIHYGCLHLVLLFDMPFVSNFSTRCDIHERLTDIWLKTGYIY